MIEITHYIEDLLLHNDCVIVPGLGGFIAQDCSAYYVEEEEIFLPPYRSVSFNPRLTMNDGLLVNEVAQQVGCSYDDAWRMVKKMVGDIRRTIEEEGQFQIHGVGLLQLSEGCTYEFVPILCGIAAPTLYGLDCVYAARLDEVEEDEELTHAEASAQENTCPTPQSRHIALVHYAAVAIAAAVFFVLCLLPIHQPIRSAIMEASIIDNVISMLAPQQQEVTAPPTPPVADNTTAQPNIAAEPIPHASDTLQTAPQKLAVDAALAEKTTDQATEKPAENVASKSADKPAKKVAEKTEHSASKQEAAAKKSSNVGPYTIVLSSAVPTNGARTMVRDLKRAGYADTRVFNDRRMVRVVYGNFRSQGAARAALRNIRRCDQLFAQAWVYKVP